MEERAGFKPSHAGAI